MSRLLALAVLALAVSRLWQLTQRGLDLGEES